MIFRDELPCNRLSSEYLTPLARLPVRTLRMLRIEAARAWLVSRALSVGKWLAQVDLKSF